MRAILHSGMNDFYASVKQMLDPSLQGKAVAVCGSTETRHGIVLAKSDLAKRSGVSDESIYIASTMNAKLKRNKERERITMPAAMYV